MIIRNLRNPKNKFEPAYHEPYKVLRRNRGGAYILEDSTGALYPRNVPPSHLKTIPNQDADQTSSFEVEAILNHVEDKEGIKYHVRWKDYSEDHDSWEPHTSFDDLETISKYWARRINPRRE